MTVIEALRAISLYPINPATAQLISAESGINPEAELTAEVLKSKPYKKAKAKVYQYLAVAPAVNEGGATYSFTDEERKAFRTKAKDLLSSIGDDAEEEDGTAIDVGWIDEEL